MRARLAAGEASRAELERVRADGADAGRRLGDAQAQRRAADRAIAAAIGVPVDAIDGLNLEWAGFDVPATDPGQGVTPELRLQALLSRADVLKAVVAYDQAEAELRGEVAKQFPAISIAPGYTWERGLVKLPFSLGLVLPPLDLRLHDEPHGELIEVAGGIWSVEGVITMPLGKFPRRMTVIVLSSGKVAIWSPISLNETEMAKLDALGPVAFLIVPNAGHRLDLKAWKDRYPEALIVAPQGAAADVSDVASVDATDNVLADSTVSFEHKP